MFSAPLCSILKHRGGWGVQVSRWTRRLLLCGLSELPSSWLLLRSQVPISAVVPQFSHEESDSFADAAPQGRPATEKWQDPAQGSQASTAHRSRVPNLWDNGGIAGSLSVGSRAFRWSRDVHNAML